MTYLALVGVLLLVGFGAAALVLLLRAPRRAQPRSPADDDDPAPPPVVEPPPVAEPTAGESATRGPSRAEAGPPARRSRAAASNAAAVDADLAAEVRALLAEGRKIEAVKLYRERIGVGLAESLAAVETIGATAPGESPGEQRALAAEALRAEAAAARAEVGSALDEDAAIVAIAQTGNLIEAIKRYRARHGGGLVEAKAAVEAMAAGGPAPPRSGNGLGPAMVELHEHLDAGNLIGAIKLYRETTGCDLKTAKEAVEAIRDRRG